MTTSPEELFWQLAAELQREDPRIQEGTIMSGRCLRVGKSFAPAGKVFTEWLAVPKPDRRCWRALLREGIAFAGR
jgi:hypothetical protein